MTKLATLFLCASAAFAADYFPLQLGNYWTYKDLSTGQTFTVRVGTPLSMRDGRVFSRIDGYVDHDLWVRVDETGNLLHLDEETGAEYPLTAFEVAAPAWAAAPFRGCEQESQRVAKPEPHVGPAGVFTDTVTLKYRGFSCADTGILSEVYAANLGLLQRTVSTIAGPRVLELVAARVGNFTFAGNPAATFDVSLNPMGEGKLNATLRLTVNAGESMDLSYGTSQDYDVVVWNSKGERAYVWSDGQFFTQQQRWRSISRRLNHEVEINTAAPLPDGYYLLEAWLTAGPGGRAFASMMPFRITDGKLVR
ncbi:MAG TPA: BsuPI-related putative proteinase inhibitor [Bryobacteraceae bacterium]|nr:BsuPI-related putative proteinase inhibitor [Bryobacteraceae bacterium]HPT27569.1 BsuPI-related putative proteinase inhibitor [Bryobacteraceae bacterium]